MNAKSTNMIGMRHTVCSSCSSKIETIIAEAGLGQLITKNALEIVILSSVSYPIDPSLHTEDVIVQVLEIEDITHDCIFSDDHVN